MLTAGAAYAGPPVTVIFKNLSAMEAHYTIVTVNESNTYTDANPKPTSTVAPSATNTYRVQNNLSPNANGVVVRYKLGTSPLGAKECVFSSQYTKILTTPNWTKNGTPSNGAICGATITSTNPSTHAWTVEFTIQ